MKIIKKSILIFGAILMLILTSATSLAQTETDGTNDVIHHRLSDGNWGYYYTDEKDNIDITSISYEVTNNNVTLTMTVDGVIEDAEKIVYWAYYTSADATYWMMYMNGTGIVYCDKDYTIGANAVVTTSEDTITGVFSLYGTDTSKVDLYGTAYQYTQVNDPNAELWMDWCPNTHSGAPTISQEEDNGGDTSSGDVDKDSGTPGFEAIILIIAICVALIILRRKKN